MMNGSNDEMMGKKRVTGKDRSMQRQGRQEKLRPGGRDVSRTVSFTGTVYVRSALASDVSSK